MSQHTPGRINLGPYEFREWRGSEYVLIAPSDQPLVARVLAYVPEHAQARRFVATWNACELFSTADLELARPQVKARIYGAILEAQRDAMQRRAEAAESDMVAAQRDCAELVETLSACMEVMNESGRAAAIKTLTDAELGKMWLAIVAKGEKLLAKHAPGVPA